MSAHRGHVCCARPLSARSITSAAIFSTHDVEVVRRDAVALEVGRRVQEIDGVRHAVLHGELDRVHLVAERGVQRLRVADDARAELGREIGVIDEVAALARIVGDRHDVGLAEREAADVLIEVDELLQRHAVRPGAVVGGEQLLRDR